MCWSIVHGLFYLYNRPDALRRAIDDTGKASNSLSRKMDLGIEGRSARNDIPGSFVLNGASRNYRLWANANALSADAQVQAKLSRSLRALSEARFPRTG